MWLILSAFVIGAFVWSTRILQTQKRAWGSFASKYSLNFEKGRAFSSPVVRGLFQDLTLHIYSEEQLAPDTRGSRFRSVVELMGKSAMPMSGAIASGDYVHLVSNLDLKEGVLPASGIWSGKYLAKTDNKAEMEALLTEECIASLNRLLKIERASFLVIFDRSDLLLRYETGDPLHDPRRLDKLVKLMAEMHASLQKPAPQAESKPEAGQEQPPPPKPKKKPAAKKSKKVV